MKKASKTEPLISVIVPVYNVEKYLKKCVDSILSQTYSNLEIILVNDGSTDSCPKICDKYAQIDKRIKVVHKTNGGLSDARNAGIEVANGQYIGFVDSDDWILPNMYSRLANLIIGHKADIAVCGLTRVYDDSILNIKQRKTAVKEYTQQEYLNFFFKVKSQTCEYYAWNKLYRKEVIERKLYPKGLTSEDVLGTYKAILNSNKIVKTNEVFYMYRINKNSITGKFSEKDFHLLQIWDSVIAVTKERHKEEYLDYALLNRYRINFTLLYRMGVNIPTKELKKNKRASTLLKDLKKNEKILLRGKIKLNRKIAIFLFCRNYYLCASMLYFIKKQSHHEKENYNKNNAESHTQSWARGSRTQIAEKTTYSESRIKQSEL